MNQAISPNVLVVDDIPANLIAMRVVFWGISLNVNDGIIKACHAQFRHTPHVRKPFSREELKQIVDDALAIKLKEMHCA